MSVLMSMESSSARASSALSTGVLPCLTTYFGPRTAWAGFTSMTWPVTSQSNSMRMAARWCALIVRTHLTPTKQVHV